MRALGIGLLVAASLASPAAAQHDAPRYLSPSSPVTALVDHLVRGGVLRGLDPLTRPFRASDVAGAVAAVDTTSLPAAVLGALRRVAGEIAPGPTEPTWSLQASLGMLTASDARRWSLRPSADSAGLYPQAGFTAGVELPHLALVTSPRIDNRLRYDPDYAGKKDRFIAGRNPEAYVAAWWRYLDVFFGQIDRNWGPPEAEGLLLSPSPYSFDHFALGLGPAQLRLELLATQLDGLPLWDGALPVARYLSLHRLVARPSERLSFSLSEAALYADPGGQPRSWEPWYLNPVNLFLVAQFDGVQTSNALLAADVVWQPRGALRVFGQAYVDDFQVDKKTTGDLEPPGYGFTLGASGGVRRGEVSWSGFYTRVTNLAYRTPAREETYVLRNAGIGRNFSDYDQLTGRLWMLASPDLLLSAELTLLRQGEGDMRVRYPAESLFASTPTLFSGVVERTMRFGVGGEWTPRPWLGVRGEIGVNRRSNADHVDGRSDTRVVWRFQAAARRSWRGPVAW